MSAKLTTTLAEDVGAEFSPAAEFNVQCDATNPRVIVDVYARLDAAASATIVDSFVPALGGIIRFVQFPFVKFGIRGNTPGTTVNVWAV